MIAHGTIRRGRFYDATVGRWFKDGYAPSQLPEFLRADCGRCGGTLTIFRTGVAVCRECAPLADALDIEWHESREG